MFFRIVENFGPEDRESWTKYVSWRDFPALTKFDSVDGILRPSLFEPESVEDWENCVNESCKTDLLTTLAYAKKILPRFTNARVVGVELNVGDGFSPAEGFLGYEILDSNYGISLLTNCGPDEENILNPHMSDNGLIPDLQAAVKIREALRADLVNHDHAENCEIWAVYSVT